MIPWVDNLVTQYADSKRQIEAYRNQIDVKSLQGQMEFETVSGMIADLQYGIDWMRIGRKPHLYRGADKTNVYRRNEVLKNMDLYPSLDLEVEDRRLTDEQKMRLADILLALSERERQCYILHMAYGLTQIEISKELKIKRVTVQKFILRAKEKISRLTA